MTVSPGLRAALLAAAADVERANAEFESAADDLTVWVEGGEQERVEPRLRLVRLDGEPAS